MKRILQSLSAWAHERPVRAVIIVALAVHLAGTWALPLIDRDEPRFAEAAREMRQRNDWIVPYFNNDYRFDKPPLIYWCQIAAYSVFGENDFAARLPSVFAAAGTALATFWLGKRMFDPTTGLRAAMMFSLCAQTMMMAKAATADMLMVLWVTVGVAAGWVMLDRFRAGMEVPRGAWWTFYISLALGFLAKGPIAWLPVGVMLVAIHWTGARGMHRRMYWPLGLLLALGLIALWGAPAVERTDGAYFSVGIGKHVVGRSVSAFEGHGSNNIAAYLALLPFYFLTVFASFFPWSLRLPGVVRWLWRTGSDDARARFLAGGILLTFAIFTLLKTKLPHYTLPAFPMLALLVAHGLSPIHGVGRWVTRWCAGTSAVAAAIFIFVFPFASHLFPSWQLSRLSKAYLRPEMEFASDEFEEPSLVWYFRKHVGGFHSKPKTAKLQRYMEKDGARFCILPTETVETVLPDADPAWVRVRARGLNVAKMQFVDLTMLIKSSPGDRPE